MSAEIEVYGRKNCAKCVTARNKIEHIARKLGYEGEIFFRDLDTPEGLSLSCYYIIDKMSTVLFKSGPNEEDVKKRVEGIPTELEIREGLGLLGLLPK